MNVRQAAHFYEFFLSSRLLVMRKNGIGQNIECEVNEKEAGEFNYRVRVILLLALLGEETKRRESTMMPPPTPLACHARVESAR